MLNSAAGVMFPRPVDPPIMTICLIFLVASGNCLKKKHKFVNEPVLAHVIGSYLAIINL